MAGILLNCDRTYFLRKGLSLNLLLANSTSLASQGALGIILCLPPRAKVTPYFCVDAGHRTQVLTFS